MHNPIDDKNVAQIKLICLTTEGDQRPLQIQIGKPYKDKNCWRCPAEMKGFYKSLPDIYGEDSLQSLCLAIRLIGKLLHDETKRGNRFFLADSPSHNKTDEFPIEAYFGELE